MVTRVLDGIRVMMAAVVLLTDIFNDEWLSPYGKDS